MNHRHTHILRVAHRDADANAGPEAAVGIMDPIMNIAIPSRLVEPRADTTTSSIASPTGSCGVNACEKSVSDSSFKLPVILGVTIPVVGSMLLFFFLHRRHVRKQREEDANDRHASMDFGLGDVPRPGQAKRMPARNNMQYGNDDEKNHQSQRQVSMDMAVNSPYLLAPELQNSRESIHSMSRHTNQKEDPYGPVNQYHPGDAPSLRSQSKQGSSIYTGSSRAPSRMQELGTSELLANAGPMPRSNPPTAFVPPPRQNSLPKDKSANLYNAASEPTPPPPYPLPAEPSAAYLSDSVQRKGLPTNPRPGNNLGPSTTNGDRESYAGDTAGLRQSNNYLGSFIHEGDRGLDLSLSVNSSSTPSPPEKSVERSVAPIEFPTPPPQAVANTLPSNPRPVRKEPVAIVQPQTATYVDNESDYGDGFNITPPSPNRAGYQDTTRGQRYSMDVPPEEYVNAGLGAPGFDARRLSMGFRPLPPDAATEHDDPEIRANRIRSFYKEYFDESKPAPQGQYYEDYDQSYLDQSSKLNYHPQPSYQQQGYYDPASNAFVMPFAEPIQRRAMTPPPQGPQGARPPPRFQGAPRPRNGSMGAMSTMSGGGRRGPPQMYPPGPYPQGPKAYSSASGRGGGNQKRALPPPAPLNTLPTPAKLKDDSFSLFNSLEFAPPASYRERVQGRSESPLGERRPYSPAVPAFEPIVSSFEELPTVPSPYTLRKSGTFTGLDFAPPKRFKDPENMSDAGSIRSNRSGISTMQNQAIRNGAYRVSKIPQDVVFTRDDMATTLKPQWGMRQNM